MLRRRLDTRLALNGGLVDYLLLGETKHGAAFVQAELEDPDYDGFVEFLPPSRADIAALWRQHRAALLEEWRRRGGQGAPWCERFVS